MRKDYLEREALILKVATELDAAGIYPSGVTVSECTGICPHSVARHMSILIAAGRLTIKSRPRFCGKVGRHCMQGLARDIDDRIEHYGARVDREWPLFIFSPFPAEDIPTLPHQDQSKSFVEKLNEWSDQYRKAS